MFCTKCGTQNPEGAGFCVKCGTKLVTDNPGSETVSSAQSNVVGSAQPVSPPGSTGNSDQQSSTQSATQTVPPVQQWSAQPQQPYAGQQAPVKKKSKTPFIAIGAIVLVIAAVLFVVFNWEGSIDYVAAVRAFQPLADSQNMSYSYGEVLDKYISNAKWESRKTDTGAYVEISGKGSGTDSELIVGIEVSKDSNNADRIFISPDSVTIGGEKYSSQDEVEGFLLALFMAYDEDYSDYSELQNAFMGNEQEEGDSLGDIIEINQTDTHYDDAWGDIEVTVKYIDFVDKLSQGVLGYDYPDEDCVYLRAFVSLKNVDTKVAGLYCGLTIIYDDTYTYDYYTSEGSFYDIQPLSSEKESTFIFEVPKTVMETDKSLVLKIGKDDNKEQSISFIIREGTTTSKNQPSTSSAAAAPEAASEPVSENFATVQEYLNDPEVRRDVDATIAQTNTDEMQLSVEATADTLFYIFEFDGAALFDADLNAVTRELEDGLQSQADAFVGIAQDIASIVDVDNVKVVVIYKISTGNELCRGEFSAY